jgi:acetyl esterase
MMKLADSALDQDAAALLRRAKEAGYPPFEALTPVQARKAYAASWDIMQTPGGDVASVRDLQIQADAPLNLRIYRGAATNEQQVLPCMLFIHGGGWVIGNLDSHDRMCRQLANMAGICVVAVDYRLAPEHPFPAGLQDAAAALKWLAANASELKIDPLALAVGGDSAGGNLAAVLALMSRDGDLPSVCFQALLYPVTDLTCSQPSYARVTSGVPLTAATMHYFIQHYTPNAADRKHWQASPLLAASLAGVAPALVFTVNHDPLCDEGRAYAKSLDEAGVWVTEIHCNDQMHGVLSQGRLIPMANVLTQQVFSLVGQTLHQIQRRSSETPVPPNAR